MEVCRCCCTVWLNLKQGAAKLTSCCEYEFVVWTPASLVWCLNCACGAVKVAKHGTMASASTMMSACFRGQL